MNDDLDFPLRYLIPFGVSLAAIPLGLLAAIIEGALSFPEPPIWGVVVMGIAVWVNVATIWRAKIWKARTERTER